MNLKQKGTAQNWSRRSPSISTPIISEDFEYAWLASHGIFSNHLGNTRIVCNGLVHNHIYHCFKEFLKKLIDTGKVASKYYIFFHAIPLIIKLRKAKDMKNALNYISKSAYEYIKSLCFMAFLVGLLRGVMCLGNNCLPSPSLSNSLIIVEA
jgi:hypothetical protein